MEFEEIIDRFLKVASEFDEIDKIILFGSFAKNKQSETSDIDIAISGKYDYFDLIDAIKNNINTLRSIDIINYDEIKSVSLREEIDRYGRVLYCKVR